MTEPYINPGAKGSFETTSKLKYTINSIQHTAYVARMPNTSNTTGYSEFIPFDFDNLYPQKVLSMMQRSGTTTVCVETLSEFLAGAGFLGMNTIVNRKKQTFWNILRFICDSVALNNGFSLHFNHNMNGVISEINTTPYDFVRIAKDERRLVLNPDWAARTFRELDHYNPYNPEKVLEELEESESIDTHKGQVLYWHPNENEHYSISYIDSILDDAQFEAESKLFSLSSLQNEYNLQGWLITPDEFDDEESNNERKEEIQADTGTANAGGITALTSPLGQDVDKLFKFIPMSRNNIDGLHTNQAKRAKENIYARFAQPPALGSGMQSSSLFGREAIQDAFDLYNSKTETKRQDIEQILSDIISNSVWAAIGDIEITPKTFIKTEEKTTT